MERGCSDATSRRADMIYALLAIVYLLVCAVIGLAGHGSKNAVAASLAGAMVFAQLALLVTR